MNSETPRQYLIGALCISLLVHVVLLLCLIYWGHLKLKTTDAPRLNVQFLSAIDAPKKDSTESAKTPISTDSKEPEGGEVVGSTHVSSGWGTQREQKYKIATEQNSQMQSRIGYERMQREGNVNLSIANIMGTLQQQNIKVSCDLRLSEDLLKAKISCLPSSIEGYIQSLLGSSNLRWEKDERTLKPICIPINSMGGIRVACQ